MSSTRNSRPPAGNQRSSARRAAEARARIEAAQRRRRLMVVLGSVGAVLAVVAVLVAVRVTSGGSSPKSGVAAAPAAASVSAQVTGVPTSVLNSVGAGSGVLAPKALTGAALTADGKPRVLYIGAEWCPYCAATRWPLAVALSRFGTLSGLGQVSSSPSDTYPSTASLTFHGASYSSAYLSLTAKEVQSNQASGSGYASLDSLDAADAALFKAAGSGFPFLDIGGRWMQSTPYDPQVLQGKTQAQIAAALSVPSSTIAKSIDGAANVITAAICRTTSQKPVSVCSSAGVVAGAKALGSAG